MSKSVIIYVIDDDDIYQFILARTIRQHNENNRIVKFLDGEEAIEFLSANAKNDNELPDIIFLDNNMPIMDGFQFMEEYAQLKPQLIKTSNIYMVTSSEDPVDIDKAKDIKEISDYLVKPIKSEQLAQLIADLNN